MDKFYPDHACAFSFVLHRRIRHGWLISGHLIARLSNILASYASNCLELISRATYTGLYLVQVLTHSTNLSLRSLNYIQY